MIANCCHLEFRFVNRSQGNASGNNVPRRFRFSKVMRGLFCLQLKENSSCSLGNIPELTVKSKKYVSIKETVPNFPCENRVQMFHQIDTVLLCYASSQVYRTHILQIVKIMWAPWECSCRAEYLAATTLSMARTIS